MHFERAKRTAAQKRYAGLQFVNCGRARYQWEQFIDVQPGTEERTQIAPDVVARARCDRAAFGEIYDHYLPRVYAFCRLYSGSQEEAEDLTAQTFERALQAIHRYDERGAPLSSWLLRIAANAANDRHRRGRDRLRRAPLLNLDHATGWLHEWEQTYWLRGHVRALPPDQQEVVRLRFYEDQPFAAVASRMGRSEGAVKQLLRRALATLQVRLMEEAAADV